MTRRNRGSGSLMALGGGRYRLRVFIGFDPLTDKPRYVSKTIRARNLTAARKMLDELVAVSKAEPAGSNATVTTILAEYVTALETERKALRTISYSRRIADTVLTPALGKTPVCDLTARDVDALIRRYADRKPATVRRYVSVLSAALSLAVKNGWISANPVANAHLPKLSTRQPELPTRAEVATLIDGMPDEVWKTAVRLAVLTGARRGELCALKWADIDTEAGVLHIRHSLYRVDGVTGDKTTKSGRERVVVLDPAVVAILEAWARWCIDRLRRDLMPTADDYVFAGSDRYVLSIFPDCSRPLNPDTLSAMVTKTAKRLDLRHVHLHSLRHFAATEMLAAGVDVRQVADTLGHADGGRLALQVYGHPTTDRQRAAAAAMANALNP